MTAEVLRELKNQHPFKPFRIHMSDGTSFLINDPENLVVPKGWTTDAIVLKPRGLFSFVYIRNVTHVSGKGLPGTRKRRGRGGSGESE